MCKWTPEYRSAYLREWRKNNPAKIAIHVARRKSLPRKSHAEYSRLWRLRNPGKAAAYVAKWKKKTNYKNPASNRVWAKNHPEKMRAYNRRSYYKFREQRLRNCFASKLKYLYGLTVNEYNALLAAQNGLCAICSNPPNGKRLAVDHDHKTNKNRALLCSHCNRKMEAVDDQEWLKKGIAYRERFND